MKGILLLFVLIFSFCLKADETEDILMVNSPDKAFCAVARRISDEDRIWRRDLDGFRLVIVSPDLDGRLDSIHATHDFIGRLPAKMKWSLDSRFLVITTTSSGGHSTWHYHSYVFCFADKSFRYLDEAIGSVTSPDFNFESPDIVVMNVRDYSRDIDDVEGSKEVKISLKSAIRKMKKD